MKPHLRVTPPLFPLQTRATANGMARAVAGFRWIPALLVLCILICQAGGATRRERKAAIGPDSTAPVATPSSAMTQFAPVPEDNPLARIWNDPEFTRRLLGSYGFLSEREPRLTAEEQALYREKILPLLQENPTNAIPVLEKAITPTASALFDYTLATIHFQHGDFTNAVRHYQTSVTKFPDFLRAQRNLGLALVRQSRYSEAIPALTRSLALGGADGYTLGLLAFAQMQESQFISAIAAYQQALLYEPANFEYQLGLVKCYVATGNYSAAMVLLDQLLSRYPDRDVLWSLQANIFIQQDQMAKAAVNYEVLRRLGKATSANLTILGDIYLREGIPDLALSAYLQAGELDGSTNLTRVIRAADLLLSRGAADEACQLVSKARANAGAGLSPDDDLKLLRLEARVALTTGAGDQAIKLLERILERDPLDGEALLLAGDYYKQVGDPERAAHRYDSAAKIEGFEATALVKHAQLLVENQRYPQAIELLRRAQRISPKENVQRYLERVEQVASRFRD